MMIVPAEEDHDANFQLINQYYDGYIQRMGWEDGGRYQKIKGRINSDL